MALNSSRREAAEKRRRQVAKRRFKGESQRDIAAYLGVSVGTVNADLKILNQRWRKAADIDTASHRARQLAEIAEVKKWAWLQPGEPAALRVILQAVKLEAQITGTIQPPSFTLNLAIITQLVKVMEDNGVNVGEAFGEWFKLLAARRQEEVSREKGNEARNHQAGSQYAGDHDHH